MQQPYPAKRHARTLIDQLKHLLLEQDGSRSHAIFLQAPPVTCRHDTDRELPYHQEANFTYLTGCSEPSSSVLIHFNLDTDDISHQLFIPPADPLVTMWSVAPLALDDARKLLESDTIEHTIALDQAINSLGGTVVHTLPLTLEFPPLPPSITGSDTTHLLEALHRARLIKDEAEIDLIREANRISSGAHEVLMRELGRYAKKRRDAGDSSEVRRDGKEGVVDWEVESEMDAEALFVATCKRAGASQAYLPICASGSRASTLHYVCNDRLFPSTSTPRTLGDTSFTQQIQRGCCGSTPDHTDATPPTSLHSGSFEPQVLLIDAGCEWQWYASDITRTMPVGNGGRFTDRAAEIYDTVLLMQKQCEAMIRPGLHWDTIHLHGHRVLIDRFLQLGIFKGDPEEILQSGITAAFFPHGLGHSLGLDVHDSRQYLRGTHTDIPDESKVTEKLYTYLRIRQTLQENMVLTVEPGCYFAPQLLEEHGVWESDLVVKNRLKEYLSVGGVRIEDVVVVRKDGVENLTTVGREREWVERVASGEA